MTVGTFLGNDAVRAGLNGALSPSSSNDMSAPFAAYPAPERTFVPANPAAKTTAGTPSRGTGAKRGRKPKNANLTTDSARTSPTSPTTSQPTPLQWAAIQSNAPGPSTVPYTESAVAGPSTAEPEHSQLSSETGGVISLPGVGPSTPAGEIPGSHRPSVAPGAGGGEEDGDGEDELLPAMADDDYSAQLSWQSQSKDNLKYAVVLAVFERTAAHAVDLYQGLDGQLQSGSVR